MAPATYAQAGVNIDAGNRAVELMRDDVRATYTPAVLAGIGAFGGLFSAAALQAMQNPVLVASTDGVGTKVKLAAQAGRYAGIGHDLVNHCINDILVQGARPLFFMDYIASARLDPVMVAEVVRGLAQACQQAGCALLGGETAEMPGVYQPNEFDVAGTMVGVVERAVLWPRADIAPGDVLVGLVSSGPHTNGYSLIRQLVASADLNQPLADGTPLIEALLAPHRAYLNVLSAHLNNPESPIKGLAHLTGGGFIENIPRILPPGLGAVVRLGTWPVPPVFTWLQQRGQIASPEMHRVFNMGIGLVAVVQPARVAEFQASLPEVSHIIGVVEAGATGVRLED